MRLILIIFYLIFTGNVFANESITPISKYKEINKTHIAEHTLIFLDIDNTIFRANGHYGSAEFFAYHVEQAKEQKNYTTAEAKLAIYDKWKKSQETIVTKFIDDEIHEFINFAKINKATIFVFTARQPVIKEITYKQLEKHSIRPDNISNFIFNKIYNKQIFPDEEWCKKNRCDHNTKAKYYNANAILYKGILFSHDLNSKGEVLKDFYTQYSSHLASNNLPLPTKIVFIDDKIENLKSMQQTAKYLNLEFYGYHIKDNFEYDNSQALIEERAILFANENGL